MSPTDSNKFSRRDLVPTFLMWKGMKKKADSAYAVYPVRSHTTDVTGNLDGSQSGGAKGREMS